ncbi:MAG: NAD-dependent epimerase/dehydratase family protein [Saprospiraceae bacterium]
MQVILGSGGAIARPLAIALASYTDQIRLCSRSPHELPGNTSEATYEHVKTDLLDQESTYSAIEGAEVAYLTAGLTYTTAAWKRDWPILIENVLSGCAKTGCKLVFFDNIYAYDRAGYGDLHEEVQLKPPSEKGQVRKSIRERLLTANAAGEVKVTIGVGANFYGPNIENSMLNETVLKNLRAGSSAQWLVNADLPHSFTFTPDAGKHLALLGNQARAYGEVWHMPTAKNPWTGRQWVSRAAAALGTKPKLTVLPLWAWRMIGWFNSEMREFYDIRDQLQVPYVFNSSKFENEFGVRPTSYEEGLKTVIA